MLTSDDIEDFNRCMRGAMRDQQRRDAWKRRVARGAMLDQQRRDAWKRRARQHHIDQAGCCTGDSACCPCPNCYEYREFYRLRPGESYLHKIHIGHEDQDSVVKWMWVQCIGCEGRGWRRKNLATGQLFGALVRYIDSRQEGVVHHMRPEDAVHHIPHIRTRTVGAASIRDEVIVHETNPSGGSWAKARFLDADAYMSREQATEFYRKHGVETPWTDPPLRGLADLQQTIHNKAKETRTMTPYEMFILFSLHACMQSELPNFASETTRHAVRSLQRAEMIECTDKATSGYRLTERARVYIAAISVLPLPVRQQAPWTMPEPQPKPQAPYGSRER